MKKVIVGLTFLCSCFLSSAQGYDKGDNVFGLGLGFVNTYVKSGAKTVVPPLQLYYEAGIHQHISVGGFVGYTVTGDEVSIANTGGNYNFKFRDYYTTVGARASYHFGYLLGTVDRLDLYGGLTMAYAFANSSVDKPSRAPDYEHSIDNDGFKIGAFAGAKYYLSDHWGMFGEVGYNMSVLQLGIVYKY